MTAETTGITRRDLLKRGALVGGAVMWATPVVQVVGMGRAYAKDVSPNCSRYCLKWNVDDNWEKIPVELTCTLGGTIHAYPVWSNNWEELGGGNQQAVSNAASRSRQSEAEPVSETGAAAAAPVAPDGTDKAAPAAPSELPDSPSTETGDAAVPEPGDAAVPETGDAAVPETGDAAVPETGDAAAADNGTQSEGNGDDHSGTVPTLPAAGAAAAATTVPDGTPIAEPEAPIAEPESLTADGEDDSVTDGNGGTILACPTKGVNDENAAKDITNRNGSEFVVYGPVIDGPDSGGFWIAFPSDIKLADLRDESEPWVAAVKCGQDDATFEMSDLRLQDDPCLADYRRIFIPACDPGRYDISHIELIVDWCP